MVELHRMVTEAALMGAPIDVVAITESHLHKLIPDGEISLPGYQPPLRCDRDPAVSKHPDGRSRTTKGGVVVYVREGLLIQEVVTDAAESYELVAFTVANTRQLILYRPDPNLHCDKLHERLSEERVGRDRFICTGDFNANLDAKKPRGASLLRHLQCQLGLRQFVKFPTYHRCSKQGKLLQQSRIDHVWANINCRCAPQHSLIRESDHMGIRISYPDRAKEEKMPRVVYRRQWRKIDVDAAAAIIDRHMLPHAPGEQLRPHLPEHALEEMARNGVGRVLPSPATPQLIPAPSAAVQAHLASVIQAWDAAWDEIKRTLVPKQRVRLPKPGTKRLAWVSKATRAKQRERNKCQRKFAKNFHDEDARRAVRDARAAVRKGLEEDAQSFIQGKWAAAGKNPGRPEHWRIFNSFAGRKVRARVQPSCTPDACNQAFLNKIKKLREPLINSPRASPERKDVPRMDHFQDITPAQAMEALRASKPKTSCGIDEIPMTALKQVGSSVPHYIALLANAVLKGQKWPEQWKRAQVSPLWKKKGCRQDPQNYRPLAMLPSISRVVERLFSEQLKAHIQAAGILPEFQHGFRKGYSCETALIDLINWVALARERGEQVVVVSADYSAAFDTLDHEVLIQKLDSQVGLHGPVLSLLDDYLNGRRQRTLIQGKPPSPWSAPVACGVPQGSVLGPLLFALYCVDIGAAVSGAKLIQYADDVTLCVSARTIDGAREKMNAALEEFESFSKANRLVPQPAKTQLMVSASAREQKRLQEFACELAQQKLRLAKAIKILGVLIDSGLTWAPHAAAAAGHADGATAAIRRNAGWLSVKDRVFLARALSLPYIDYCQTAMEGASASAINSLQRAYHRAARMACRMERHSFRRRGPVATERSEAALRRTGWPTWPRRRRAAAAAVQDLVHTHVVARKAFTVWARGMVNRVLAGNTFEGCSPDISRPEAERAPRSGRPPPDEDLQERRHFYSLIQDKYRAVREHSTPDGRVIAWTDGGCSTVHGTPVAGAGIYYGQGNERNCMRRVTGDQSSARAEVTAMCHVLETDQRRLRVVTDNMYVCKGVNEWRLQWRQKAWFRSPLSTEEIHHADSWRRIDALMDERGANQVEVVWRKAHALQRHINAGQTTELDVYGNNMADQLATQAVRNAAGGGPDKMWEHSPQLDLSDPSLRRAAALAAAADASAHD
eukprot:gene17802-biopygen18929